MRKKIVVNLFVSAFFSTMLSAADTDSDKSTNEAASTLSESGESILREITIEKPEACGVTLDELASIMPLEGLHTILDLRALSIVRYVAHGAAFFVGIPLTLSLGKICSAAAGMGCSAASGVLLVVSIGGVTIPCVYGILKLKNFFAGKHNQNIKTEALYKFFKYRDHKTLAGDDDIKFIGTALYGHPELLKKLSPAQTMALAEAETDPAHEELELEQSEDEFKKLQNLLTENLGKIEKTYHTQPQTSATKPPSN